MGKTMGWRHIKVALLYLFCISIYVYIFFQIKPQALIKLKIMNGNDQSTMILEQQRKMKRKMTLCANLFKLHQSNTKTNILRFETSSDHYVHNEYRDPVLTLFTTWTATKDNYARRNTTVENWAMLKPFVVPLLFTTDEDLRERVEIKGWKTLPILKTGIGIPVLKDMYITTMSKFQSKFYAYANGDILFTDNLLLTLFGVMENIDLQNNNVLITGQRTNVLNISKQESTNFTTLREMLTTRGELFTPWAMDYFISTRNFPWKDMPDVVIGRRGFDNFLVMESQKREFMVIDATNTILAVHHTTGAGNFEHLSKGNVTYNTDLISEYYDNKTVDYRPGLSTCSKYYSDILANGQFVIRARKTFSQC